MEIEEKSGQQQGGEERGDQHDLTGEELALDRGRDQQSQAQRHQEIEGRHAGEYRHRPAKGHVEQPLRRCQTEHEPKHAEDEIGDRLAEQQLVGPDGRDEHRLHRSALPLARHYQCREETTDQRHHQHDRVPVPGSSDCRWRH